MSAASKDLEERKKLGEALDWEAPALPQAGVEAHLGGTCLNTKTKNSEKQPAATPKDVLYQGLKTCWAANMGKAGEAEDPFPPPRVNVVQGSKWRTRWAAKWDDPVE